MTTSKSCCFLQDKIIDIDMSEIKKKSDLTFPDILDGQPVVILSLDLTGLLVLLFPSNSKSL